MRPETQRDMLVHRSLDKKLKQTERSERKTTEHFFQTYRQNQKLSFLLGRAPICCGKKLEIGVNSCKKSNPKWSRYHSIWSESSTVKDTCLFKVCWEKTNFSKNLATRTYRKLIFISFFFNFFYEPFP